VAHACLNVSTNEGHETGGWVQAASWSLYMDRFHCLASSIADSRFGKPTTMRKFACYSPQDVGTIQLQ